jgi:hypothetical protein
MWATRLSPTEIALAGIRKLEAHWFASDVPRGGHPPGLMDDYRTSLRDALGDPVTYSGPAEAFEEALYPIDVSERVVRFLTGDPEFRLPAVDPLGLFVLGANSD